MAMSSVSLKNIAMLSLLLFMILSIFLFVQHELHSKKQEVDGLDISYKRFRKTVTEDMKLIGNTVSEDLKLIENEALKDFHIIQQEAQKDFKLITDTTTKILHIPTVEELESQHRLVHKSTTPTAPIATTPVAGSDVFTPPSPPPASAGGAPSGSWAAMQAAGTMPTAKPRTARGQTSGTGTAAAGKQDDDVREDDDKSGANSHSRGGGKSSRSGAHGSSSTSSHTKDKKTSGGKADKGGNDDTPKADDASKNEDDDVREDDDDVIQEPGEEPRYFTAKPKAAAAVPPSAKAQPAVSTTSTKRAGSSSGISSTGEEKVSKSAAAVATPPELPMPQDHVLSASSSSVLATVKVDGALTSTKLTAAISDQMKSGDPEQRGVMICNGKQVDSEVIYWRVVPGDAHYESPITPHHGLHHDRYLSFEYDQGGWNNVRMSLECLIVVAHAMGRTLVIPPQQHLYLLGATHQDKHDKKAHDEMGFEDFFDIDLLRSHRGMTAYDSTTGRRASTHVNANRSRYSTTTVATPQPQSLLHNRSRYSTTTVATPQPQSLQ